MGATEDYESLRRLNDRQLAAIDAILGGASYQEAATAVGVHRVTVSGWVNHHPEFQAELNRRREALLDQRADRIRRMDELALEHFQQKIESGDDHAIETWIKVRGLARVDTSRVGPTDGEEVIARRVEERYREAGDQVFEEIMDFDRPEASRRDGIRKIVEDELLERTDVE